MNFFLLILLVFNIFVTILFGIIFFQLKTLDYATTGCDTEAGKEKIKSTLGNYDRFLIGLIVTLAILALYPIFSLVKNILPLVLTGFGGSIVSIVISAIELAVIIGLISFMVVILVNIRKVSGNPCGDKGILNERLDYVYNLVKIAFIISIILTVIIICATIGYFIYSYNKKKKEAKAEADYEQYLQDLEIAEAQEQVTEQVQEAQAQQEQVTEQAQEAQEQVTEQVQEAQVKAQTQEQSQTQDGTQQVQVGVESK